MKTVLISLYKGYGLGDGVQMSAVLRHLAKYRPDWRIDYRADEGRHQVGRGIAQNTFAWGEIPPSWHYDMDVNIRLYDTWANWQDRPNTRVSSCLHEVFDLPWDPECGRYQVNVREEVEGKVRGTLHPFCRRVMAADRELVALHYRGDSSGPRKNLSDQQALNICRATESLQRSPVLLDWRNDSPLPQEHEIYSMGRTSFAAEWGPSAEHNCAVISQCAAFIGIDSGPSKCASATDTPALVIWTGHHPAPFHDPAPNTTHLVPVGYHGLHPVCNNPGVIAWFEAHHNVRQYQDDPIREIKQWLEETCS